MAYSLIVSRHGVLSDDMLFAARDALVLRGIELVSPVRLASSAAEMELLGSAVPERSQFTLDLPLDINLVPHETREKSVLIADMDSTIIGVECIDEIADFAGVKAEVAAVTEAAMRGELDFSEALYARVSKIKGVTVDELQTCYNERVRLNPGAETLVRTMNARGAKTILASGGFTFFAAQVAENADFSEFHANELAIEADALTGGLNGAIVDGDKKAEILNVALEEAGLLPIAAMAVGDGANDLKMITRAGLGAAYRAKPALREAADIVLDHSDLTALLAVQGISEHDWVLD